MCCVCDDECATLGQALATGVSLNGKRGESDVGSRQKISAENRAAPNLMSQACEKESGT